jgi:arsenite oxidase large subunit
MGVDELNYAYEDYTLTDTIFIVGANPLETQTNLLPQPHGAGDAGRREDRHRRSAPHGDRRLRGSRAENVLHLRSTRARTWRCSTRS